MTSPIDVRQGATLALLAGGTVRIPYGAPVVLELVPGNAGATRLTLWGRSFIIVGSVAVVSAALQPWVALDAVDVTNVAYTVYLPYPSLPVTSIFVSGHLKNAGANPATCTQAPCILREDGTELLVAAAPIQTTTIGAGAVVGIASGGSPSGTHYKFVIASGAGIGPISGILKIF